MRNRFKKILSLIMITIICTHFMSVPQKAQAADYSKQILGEIRLFAGTFTPEGWAFCDGQILEISKNTALFSILGTTYGGNGIITFALPNLNGRVPIGYGYGPGLTNRELGVMGGVQNVILNSANLPSHNHGNQLLKFDVPESTATVKVYSGRGTTQVPGTGTVMASGMRNERVYSDAAAERVDMMENSVQVSAANTFTLNTSSAGGGNGHNNMSPYLTMNYIICLQGEFPSRFNYGDPGYGSGDENSYTGEIKMFAGNYAPKGWLPCNGSMLEIAKYEDLYSLIDTTYGGDGMSYFRLPDLSGRAPLGAGQGPGLSNYTAGQTGGLEKMTLFQNEISPHIHTLGQLTQNLHISGDMSVSDSKGSSALPEGNVPAVGLRSERIYTSAASDGSMNQDSLSMSLSFSDASANLQSSYVGESRPHENMMPYTAINYIINPKGASPYEGASSGVSNFIGAVEMYAFNFAPSGRALCNGELLSISYNQTLFNLLGTTYGGDGSITFNLPDTRGRMVIGKGNSFSLGSKGGEEKHTLTLDEMPEHVHRFTKSTTITGSGTFSGTNASGNKTSPLSSVFSRGYKNERIYSSISNKTMTGVIDISADIQITPIDSSGNPISGDAKLTLYGGGQAHDNMIPYTAITFAITLEDIDPSED